MKMKNDNKKKIDSELNRVLLNDFDRIEGFVRSYWKHMLIGAGVIIVIVAVAYGVILKKEKNEKAAKLAVAVAVKENNVEKLNDVISKYGDYSSTDNARAVLAKKYFEEKKFDDAAKLYKEVAVKTQDVNLRAQMLLNEAAALEAAAKIDAALKAYAAIGDNAAYGIASRSQAYYQAARIAQSAGKNNEFTAYLAKLNTFSVNLEAESWCLLGNKLNTK